MSRFRPKPRTVRSEDGRVVIDPDGRLTTDRDRWENRHTVCRLACDLVDLYHQARQQFAEAVANGVAFADLVPQKPDLLQAGFRFADDLCEIETSLTLIGRVTGELQIAAYGLCADRKAAKNKRGQ
jgi:hypothetical protein